MSLPPALIAQLTDNQIQTFILQGNIIISDERSHSRVLRRDENAPDGVKDVQITGNIGLELTLTPMRGRDDDLRQVHDALNSKRPVFIIGVGGLGKSRLAAEALLTGDMANGAIWHRISDVSRPEAVIELLRQHFHLEATVDRPQVLEKLRQYQRIVVLDNAEDVPENDPRRADYVRLINELHAHDARVIVTSRVEWSDVRAVSKVEPTQLDPEPARQVVLDMAEAYKVEIGEHADAIAQGARYHPRLIEWAIGQMERKPVARVLETLTSLSSRRAQEALYEMVGKTHAQMIAEVESNISEIKQNVFQRIKRKRKQLNRPSQLLARLLVTRGGFTYEAGAYICGASDRLPVDSKPNRRDWFNRPITDSDDFDDAINTLTRWRFLSYDTAQKRYTISPVVINAIESDKDAHKAHYDYYYALVKHHKDRQHYIGLAIESDNLEMAFEWAIRSQRADDALWFYNGWDAFLANRGRFAERLENIERAITALQNTGASAELLANAQNTLGIIYVEHPYGERDGNLKRAINAYHEALRFRTPDRSPIGYAHTQNNLGTALMDLANLSDDRQARWTGLNDAVIAYRRSLRFRTPDRTPLDYAMTLNNLGTALKHLANLADDEDTRRACLQETITAYNGALNIQAEVHAPLDYAMTLNNLGSVLADLANSETEEQARWSSLQEAIEAYHEALRFWTPQSNPYGYAITQSNLGTAYEDLGDIVKALSCWHEAEIYYRQVGHVASANQVRGWIDYYEGQSGGGGEGA